MSNIKYGLISECDKLVLEKTIDLIVKDFEDELINITEVGVYAGETGHGIENYVKAYKERKAYLTGIDNNKDNELMRYWVYDKMIIGNSNEVYNQLEDNSQHLIIQDANHSYPNVIQDFFCYMRKVKIGGYMWWHDVAPHAQGKDWQRMGDKEDKDMSISVRKALMDIGLFDNKFEGWNFVMEDADLNNNCGGCALFKKLY